MNTYGIPSRVNGKKNPEYLKAWNKAHKQEIREYQINYDRRFLYAGEKIFFDKLGAYCMLGGCCAVCGCNDIRMLEIDHIQPRDKQDKLGGISLHMAIVNEKYPVDNLQLLCACCHKVKSFNNGDGYRKIQGT